jgi:SAM-dependent methyltransferase
MAPYTECPSTALPIGSSAARRLKAALRPARELVRKLPYLGVGRHCPVCRRSSRRFRPFGIVERAEAQCVHCGALERHRLVWLFLARRTDLFDGRPRRMLHLAPEECLAPRLRRALGEGYLSADLADPRAMVRMDVTAIRFPDESFDVIYCSHVLEHVPDDRRAMRELHRVLKRDGFAVFMVPVGAERTFEDPAIVEPAARRAAFGQEDHVRVYGPDVADRLAAAGFLVTIARPADFAEEIARCGLGPAAGEVFHCAKGEA